MNPQYIEKMFVKKEKLKKMMNPQKHVISVLLFKLNVFGL